MAVKLERLQLDPGKLAREAGASDGPGPMETKRCGVTQVVQSPDFSALIAAAGRVAQGAEARAAALDDDGATSSCVTGRMLIKVACT